MTTPNSDPDNRFDWDAYEAEVVDLDRLRKNRADKTHKTETTEPTEPTLDTTGGGPDVVDAETVQAGPDGVGVPVDPPAIRRTMRAVVADAASARRKPVVPGWLWSATARAEFIRSAAGNLCYHVQYRTVRIPLYTGKAAGYAPIGGFRLLSRAVRWATAEEGNWSLRQAAADRGFAGADVWLQLDRQRERQARWRWPVLLAGLLALTTAAALLAWTAPWWWTWLTLATVIPVLARFGRPADKPILDRVTTGERFTRLTADMVRTALCSLGIGGIKDPASVKFPQDIHRDGPGYLARVNLPQGVEAEDVLERRGKLSSALRLPVDQVWPSPGPDHAGQLDLWVGYQPSSKMGRATWTLATPKAQTSVFEPIPFGVDERMRAVTCVLFQRNFLIGGQPGSGKTFGGRALVLGAMLDPTAEVWLAAFKPAEDFYDVSGFCARYACGIDDPTMQAGAQMVADGLREVQRRQTLLGKLKREGKIKEGKTSPELARAGLGLHPLVLVFDEVHELFLSDKAVADLLIRLVKQGRSAGVIVILITQVAGKDSVPPELTRCVSSRWCMSVADQVANDQIMGTGAYKQGRSGTAFRPEVDAGWGVTDGMAGTYRGSARAYYPDQKELAILLDRIRTVRGTSSPVTGTADDQTRRNILADVLAIFTDREPGVHWEVIADRLADHDPTYRAITTEVVSARLRAEGVESVDVKMRGQRTPRKGARRADITTAINKKTAGEDGRG